MAANAFWSFILINGQTVRPFVMLSTTVLLGRDIATNDAFCTLDIQDSQFPVQRMEA